MGTQIANEWNDEVLLVGASNGPEAYLLWQFGGDEPDTVHFEYDDQMNGNYDNVEKVVIARGRVCVHLIDGTMIELPLMDVSEAQRSKLIAGLREVYQTQNGILEVTT